MIKEFSSDYIYNPASSLGKMCSCGKCPVCLRAEIIKNKIEPNEKTDTQSDSSDNEEIDKLKRREMVVKAHEQSHAAAGAMSPNYTYTTGPDGKQYITGGEADINLSKGSTPEETIANAEKVKRAALAPSEPSAQDRAVAREAEAMILEAKKEILEREQAKFSKNNDGKESLYNQYGEVLSQEAERGFLFDKLA
ncbi:MAG: hypothetical protein JXR48_12610 [Candidatus Delongbacteria bacterium]|nr:hypothetical protein [Candidatus Delongbacteria bacterium]MBN2835793.1 hypothetical protein [Candidatus Delongbacteria bacterium]